MKVKKGFKYRIYPNKKQQEALAVQFGHARFVYNHYRAAREGFYLATGTGLTYRDCAGDLAAVLKADHPWLRAADSQALQQSLKDLDRAYHNFFAGRAGYPQFKSKHKKQSIRYPQRFKVNSRQVYLPKVGWVKAIFHRAIEGVMKNCTVSKTKSGIYFVAIQCEIELDDRQAKPTRVGIDLDLTTFVTLSTGEKIVKPKHLHRSQRRLKIRQRRLSRKVKGSHNRAKARHGVAVAHEHVANQRRDFHHQLSGRLAGDYGLVAFESLNVSGMLKNHNLAKAIADAGWSQFVAFTAYKTQWAGGEVLKVDRFFPSSKLCSDCHQRNNSLTLQVRQWLCLNCGAVHDRDENAAVNILNEATGGAPESHALGDTIAVRRSAQEAQRL